MKKTNSKFMIGNKFALKKNPGVRAIHIRVITKYGSASKHKCVDCPEMAVHWSNKDRNKYSTNLKRYEPRCQKCHWIYDGHSDKMKGNKNLLGFKHSKESKLKMSKSHKRYHESAQ